MMVFHYKIIEKIGSGGMGDVFLADDTKLGRRVALKFLSSQIADDSSLRARFAREVQAVATLNHPNIVHVYEVSEFQGRPFFVMEHVEGQSLRDVIRGGVLGFDEILRIAVGICEGLEAAHHVGIVHRDIKPANIVIDRGRRVKILDFGLAKRATDPDLTIVGSTLGTVSYMSPEQVQGKESDRRSDIFSLGIVLYEMITGRLPFKGAFDAATLTAIVTEAADPLARHRPDVPPEFQPIMDRLLSKELGDRYQDLSELLPDLESLRDQLRFASDPKLSAHRLPAKSGSRGKVIAGVAAAAIVVIALSVMLMRPSDDTTTSDSTVEVPPDDRSVTADVTSPPTPSSQASTDVADSIRMAEIANREARLREMEDSITRAAQAQLDAHATVSRADSLAMERLKDSLQRVQDELTQARQARSPSPATGRADTVLHASTQPSPSDGRPDPIAAARERHKDSTDVLATLASFWQGLEARNTSGMKASYPDMPSKSEAMWQMFLDNARDLDIASEIRSLSLDGGSARATVAVQMSYRDAGGRRAQDLVYAARLRKAASGWVITNLEQNR